MSERLAGVVAPESITEGASRRLGASTKKQLFLLDCITYLTMTKYEIRDEAGDLMRIVGRLEEAKSLIAVRKGWSYKRVKDHKPAFVFEEAPF